jgi:hypothetical protein
MSKIPRQHSEFLMVLVLFLTFRLLLLFLYTPSSELTGGFMAHAYYYDMAALSAQGHFPFIDFWFEYPPAFSYLAIGIYRLASLLNPSFSYFDRLLTMTLLPFEVLTLVNLYRIGRRLYDSNSAIRITWIYSALLLPVFYWQHSFDTIIAALMLEFLYLLITNRWKSASIALGLAIATKLTPFFLLGTLWRFAPDLKRAVTTTLSSLAVAALTFVPFLVLSPVFTIASFQSLATVSSWSTIWALVDGNFGFGDVGPLARHFDPLQAGIPVGNGPVFSWWITVPFFAILFLIVFSRPVDRRSPRTIVAFSGLVFMLFLLWSKGWGPEWAVSVIPFLILLYPNWRGVLAALVLTFASFLDWPISLLLSNSPDRLLYVMGVLTRAFLFILIAVDLYKELARGQEMQPAFRKTEGTEQDTH